MNHFARFEERVDEAPLKAILKHFTYRPGWRFTIHRGMLYVDALVIDANQQDRNAPLAFRTALPTMVHDDFPWERWLFDTILGIERHEAAEFFQINGTKTFDPHAND